MHAKEEKSFSRLSNMGIFAWEQVLLHLPSGHKDYSKINPYLPANEALYPVDKACYELTVESEPNKDGVSPPRLSFWVTDSCESIKLVVFGDIWAWQNLTIGQKIVVEGVVDRWEGRLQIKSPALVPRAATGRVMPVYRGKRGASKALSISPEFVYEKTRDALNEHLDATRDFILSHFQGMDEASLIKRAGISFYSLTGMLRAIHKPRSLEEAKSGMLDAKRLCVFEVVFNAERQSAKKPNPKSVVPVKQADVDFFIGKLPFSLTDHQRQSIDEIVTDLRAPYSMNRLLSGDVGFGKTDVALIPALAAQRAGARVVVMCPSGLIVKQWLDKVVGFDRNMPVQVVTSETKIDKELLKKNPIMIGTNALSSRLPKLKWMPDYVIFDEQQKHGKNHKDKLVSPNTNKLEATATCQPKTSALVNYGGMDESILNQCPVEKKISSRVVMRHERDRLLAHVKKLLAEKPGAQMAIIYPNVTSSAENSKTSVIAGAASWERLFPGQVAMLHGKLKDEEKASVVARMLKGEARILCATILIETGLTLPSLMGMVVVGADCFGVSALHQLRGRLARHGGSGYFYMYLPDESVQEETLARLNLVASYTDGFILAEKDAEMRGYGSMNDEDMSQSGVSRSTMFSGIRLMPKDLAAHVVSSSR